MSEIFCSGYLRMNGYKSQYVLSDNKLLQEISAEFLYRIYDETFDRNGKIVGRFQVDSFSKYETKVMNHKNLWPIQIGYDFYEIDIACLWDIPSIQDVTDALNNSNMGNFDYYHKQRNWQFDKYNKPHEVCTIGATRYIAKIDLDAFMCVDYAEYTKRFYRFVSKYTKSEKKYDDITRVYNMNIDMASCFYNTPKDQIISPYFNKTEGLIKRLKIKISEFNKSQI